MTETEVKMTTKTQSTLTLGEWSVVLTGENGQYSANVRQLKEAENDWHTYLVSYSVASLWQLSEVLKRACRYAGYKPPGAR